MCFSSAFVVGQKWMTTRAHDEWRDQKCALSKNMFSISRFGFFPPFFVLIWNYYNVLVYVFKPKKNNNVESRWWQYTGCISMPDLHRLAVSTQPLSSAPKPRNLFHAPHQPTLNKRSINSSTLSHTRPSVSAPGHGGRRRAVCTIKHTCQCEGLLDCQ